MTYNDKESPMAPTVKELDDKVAELTAELQRLTAERNDNDNTLPQPGTAEGATPRRSDFGYLMLGALLGRPGETPLPIVDASRDKTGTITFTFADKKHIGTHAEVQADVNGSLITETVAIRRDTIKPQTFTKSAAVNSILILNNKDGHIVAVGPKLPAL